MLGSRTALSVALCAGALLVLFSVLADGAGEGAVHRVAAVQKPGTPEVPGVPRTMVAFYYDHSLAGLRTASGEPFDPEGYTAAHRTMPLGTRLLVSYEGRSVRVSVNDRGPYVPGHDLDLSLAAAREIGLVAPEPLPSPSPGSSGFGPPAVGYKQGSRRRKRMETR